MKKEELITIILILSFFGVVIWFAFFRKTSWQKFWKDVLYGVISREYGMNTPCTSFYSSGCTGKRYTDVLHLDSGTIGIAHFASSGLCRIYEKIDTQQYFNRSQSEMCDNWADKNSGASDQNWWVDGFTDFVNSPESEKVQNEAFAEARQSAVDDAIAHGWKTDRQMSIAVGVSNSYGNSGFSSKAANQDWNAEDLLDWYGAQSSHKNKRKIQIDKWFPKGSEKKLV